jgi:hypothetical protein
MVLILAKRRGGSASFLTTIQPGLTSKFGRGLKMSSREFASRSLSMQLNALTSTEVEPELGGPRFSQLDRRRSSRTKDPRSLLALPKKPRQLAACQPLTDEGQPNQPTSKGSTCRIAETEEKSNSRPPRGAQASKLV